MYITFHIKYYIYKKYQLSRTNTEEFHNQNYKLLGINMIRLDNKKTGIVLSGGGAKGIYQVGMFRALEEMGLSRDSLVLSGTSIGAMNALQYACNDTDSMRKFIHALGRTFEKVKDVQFKSGGNVIKDDYVKEFLKEHYSDDSINKNNVPITVCAFSSGSRKPEYFKLNDYSPEEQRMLTLASGSLPGVMPPVKFRGNLLSDGAVLPNLYEAAALPDKIPVNAMVGEELGIMIICYLKPEDQVPIPSFDNNVKIYEIHPSRSLEKVRGMGTLDFSESVLAENEELGYNDTIHFFYHICFPLLVTLQSASI